MPFAYNTKLQQILVKPIKRNLKNVKYLGGYSANLMTIPAFIQIPGCSTFP